MYLKLDVLGSITDYPAHMGRVVFTWYTLCGRKCVASGVEDCFNLGGQGFCQGLDFGVFLGTIRGAHEAELITLFVGLGYPELTESAGPGQDVEAIVLDKGGKDSVLQGFIGLAFLLAFLDDALQLVGRDDSHGGVQQFERTQIRLLHGLRRTGESHKLLGLRPSQAVLAAFNLAVLTEPLDGFIPIGDRGSSFIGHGCILQ